MNIGFSTISTITQLKETDQINNAQISSFRMVLFNLLQLLQKKAFRKKPNALKYGQKFGDL